MNKILCVGGPWDGQLTDDIGAYLRVHKEQGAFDPLKPSASRMYEIVVYIKIAWRRKDGGVIYMYEAEDTDSTMELWEFYLKNKAKAR